MPSSVRIRVPTLRVIASYNSPAGQWLQYLDADDYLLPDKVNRHMTFVEHNPEIDVVYSPVTLIFDSGREHTIDIEQVDDHVANYLLWAPFATHSVLFRTEAIRAIGAGKRINLAARNTSCCCACFSGHTNSGA